MYYLVHMNLINLTTTLTSLDIMTTIFLIDAEAIRTNRHSILENNFKQKLAVSGATIQGTVSNQVNTL